MEKLRPYRHNISHSDQILQLLNLPVVPVNIIQSGILKITLHNGKSVCLQTQHEETK